MRALVSLPEAPFAQLAEVPEPAPRHDEAIVAVHAISLNRGETRRLAMVPAGSQHGWDLAGEVVTAAVDGSGPAVGARVVGLVDPGTRPGVGAWAQRVPVAGEYLAELPDGISYAQAAALPVAGLTALIALEWGGFVVGRRVLVTGASGGVGRFAIQLAKLGGAHVTALARRAEGLAELGADELISELAVGDEARDASGRADNFDVVLDGIGGPVLGAALQRVAPHGTVVSYASTVPDDVSYPPREFFARASGAQLRGFYLFAVLRHSRSAGPDLRRLADLMAAGRLDPQIDLELDWGRAGEAIEALLERRVSGKAVLTIA